MDPFAEIDWDSIDDSAWHLPPEYLPLYGTAQWEAMSEAQRVEYSRHEVAALCGAGIWLENILMRVLIDQLYTMKADHPAHRYSLIEVADECRHSQMFGEFIRRAGTPAYRPTRLQRLLGSVMKLTYGRMASFLAILAAEELLDVMNRAVLRDKTLHPVSREMARIHVIEEARHMSFARVWLEEALPRASALERAFVRLTAPLTVDAIVGATLNPDVYATLGIDGGYAAAKNNPHYRQRIAADLRGLTDFLGELGVITQRSRKSWTLLGLLPQVH